MGRPFPGNLREAVSAGLHELSERLTSLSNYLAAALRLSDPDAGAEVAPDVKEILDKAFGQVTQADDAIKRLRRLLEENARKAGTRSADE